MRLPALRILAALVALAGGCAHRGTAPAPVATGAVWPEPPAVPRVKLEAVLTEATPARARSWWRTAARWITGGTEEDEAPPALQRPFGVLLAPSGDLLVADPDGRRVLRYDRRGRPAGELACAGHPFGAPMALARAQDGAILVADAGAAEIVRWTPEGCRVLRGARLQRPTGIAAGDGRLLVADPPAHQVIALSEDGRELARFGERGDGPGQFQFPSDVALGPDGSIWVVDALNFRLVVLDANGRWTRAFGAPGEEGAGLARPKGIAVDAGGRVYLSDAQRDVVLVFSPDGALDYAIGATGTGPGRFAHPAGVSVAGGRLAIADSLNRRVQVFEILGGSP